MARRKKIDVNEVAAPAEGSVAAPKKRGRPVSVAPVETVTEEPKKRGRKPKAAAAEKIETPQKDAKKPESQPVEEIRIQVGSQEWDITTCKERVLAAYAEAGHAEKVHKVSIYIKPEDSKAYYVVNDSATGSIDL